MKTKIFYKISEETAKKIAYEEERAVETNQTLTFDAKEDIKELIIEAGGNICHEKGELSLDARKYFREINNNEIKEIYAYSDKILNKDNVEEFLRKIIKVKEEERLIYKSKKVLFEQIGLSYNFCENYKRIEDVIVMIAKNKMNINDLKMLKEKIDEIMDFDEKFLMQKTGYRAKDKKYFIFNLIANRSIGKINLLEHEYKQWKEEKAEKAAKAEKIKKAKEKEEEELKKWINENGSETLKMRLKLGYDWEELAKTEKINSILKDVTESLIEIEIDDDEVEEEFEPSLDAMKEEQRINQLLSKKECESYAGVVKYKNEEVISVEINNTVHFYSF